MARDSTSRMREEAITLLPAAEILDDDNASPGVEAAFDEWRESLKTAQSEGTVRAYRLPLLEDGSPNQTAKNQVQLGVWPVDQYTMDELCVMIKKKYMIPGERYLAVRFIGTQPGTRGVRFSQVVVMQRENDEQGSQGTTTQPESATQMMRVLQEMQQNNARFLESISRGALPVAPTRDPMDDMIKMMTAMGSFMGAMGARGGSAGGVGDLKSLVETMALLDDMRGERGGGGSDDSGVAGIIKAVAPLAGPLLQMAATQQANRVALPAPTIPIPPQPVRDMSGVPSRPAPVAPPTSNPSAPTSQPISEAEMFGELKPIVDNLVLTMQNGAEPVGVADFFFEQTFMNIEDDKVYDQLADFVESPTCIQRLGFFNPAVTANVAWFEKFRARVIELLNAPEAPAVQGPPNPAPVTPAA